MLDVEKADDGKRDRTDAVDLQVLHRVNQANIQIAAKLLRPILTVDNDRLNLHMHRHIQTVRVERHRVDLVHDIVLLHVRVHHLISGELEKFP